MQPLKVLYLQIIALNTNKTLNSIPCTQIFYVYKNYTGRKQRTLKYTNNAHNVRES